MTTLQPGQSSEIKRLSELEARSLVDTDLDLLMSEAAARRNLGHGLNISFSKKVFIPLTKLCRDVCHYCTFARVPKSDRLNPYLSIDEAIAIARAGAKSGCKEALFTLGDKPELRYESARHALDALGYPSTLAYLEAVAERVFQETGLLPHLNPGVMDSHDLRKLRRVSASMGIMLESTSTRLCEFGGVHFGSPDKLPSIRLATIREAGIQKIPFTTGILVGIGETRTERIEALLALRTLHEEFDHLQEIIIQNFRPKTDTLMGGEPALSLTEHLWTIAAARLIFSPSMSIQCPPNLRNAQELPQLIAAGINDWGGVSPVTPDHVNPEAPWPALEMLERVTHESGMSLAERLSVYPRYAQDSETWVDKKLQRAVIQLMDTDGFARSDNWHAGAGDLPPPSILSALSRRNQTVLTSEVSAIINRLVRGSSPTTNDLVRLFQARGQEFHSVCASADALRAQINGDNVTFVVNRNINYTNICAYQCRFCAFAKGKTSKDLRGSPYILDNDTITARVREAALRGATEVCMQGGIHPSFTGKTYLDICAAAKNAVPDIHIHAFSPLEIFHGATTLDISIREFLTELKAAGLRTLPGTAAEILDDSVRAVICPDKINTMQWLEIMRTAHSIGLKTTSTIMFGHVDKPIHWARHLLAIRELQSETGGFTEFVPLPFVHMESPLFKKWNSRRGPSFREAILMHAVARLALNPVINNIQASWVKLGREGARACLNAGANDLGGTLMNESISRAAGASHGQEMVPSEMQSLIHSIGRTPIQRRTDYSLISDTTSHSSRRDPTCRMGQAGPIPIYAVA
jgi:FO synthase